MSTPVDLRDERQRLISYAASLSAWHTSGSHMPKAVLETAWDTLTNGERDAIVERWLEFVAPEAPQ